jgi:hypothetical protein
MDPSKSRCDEGNFHKKDQSHWCVFQYMKYIFWHNAKMSRGTYFFPLKYQNRNNFLTEKDILNAIEIFSNICFHSDMTLTLHVTVIQWGYSDLKVNIVLARKWNLFDVNPGFSCQVIEFVLQFPMIYTIREQNHRPPASGDGLSITTRHHGHGVWIWSKYLGILNPILKRTSLMASMVCVHGFGMI